MKTAEKVNLALIFLTKKEKFELEKNRHKRMRTDC